MYDNEHSVNVEGSVQRTFYIKLNKKFVYPNKSGSIVHRLRDADPTNGGSIRAGVKDLSALQNLQTGPWAPSYLWSG
jgi:hypothetical protein